MNTDVLRGRLADWISPESEWSDDVQRVGLTGRSNSLGTVADVSSIVLIIYSLVSLVFFETVPQAVLAVALAGIAVTFMITYLTAQRRYQRETQRINSMQHLVACHGRLREASVALLRGEEVSYTVHTAEAARCFATYMTHATGVSCRVTIQEVVAVSEKVGDAVVSTICRSFDVEPGSREDAAPRQDKVGDNTDFESILDGKVRTFFHNDLSKLRGYKNSHFDTSLPAKKYPYRSTIVWPILGPSLLGADLPGDIVGFLSLDARTPGVFTRSLDVPAGKIVAAALYSSLSEFQAMRDASDETELDEAGEGADGQQIRS